LKSNSKCKEIRYFQYLGVKINNVDFPTVSKTIADNIKGRGYICLTDVGNVISATRDRQLLEAINGSLLSIADGMPLAWYGKMMGCNGVERISGMELMKRLLERSEFKHFLLGDTQETINRVIEKATRVNTTIKICGYSPSFRKAFNDNDNKNILNKINAEDPDIVWVAFGGGKQEKWMHENIQRLNRGIMIGVGAAFRFYIGEIKAPPRIFQNLGLQWFFRMMEDPIRIGRRQLITFPIFIMHFPFEVAKARKEIRNENKFPIQTC
jgi:N-acetylglucosaminyldiphosphoundecaprenol N-acetyl-beta-D-mannosaminyltransferase